LTPLSFLLTVLTARRAPFTLSLIASESLGVRNSNAQNSNGGYAYDGHNDCRSKRGPSDPLSIAESFFDQIVGRNIGENTAKKTVGLDFFSEDFAPMAH
jgi:hypothetical protein